MKKVLLLSLGLVMGVSAFAQMRMPKGTEKKQEMQMQKFVAGTEQVQSTGFAPVATPSMLQTPQSRYDELNEAQVIMTTQDNQSNGGVSNRLVQWQDGSAAVVTTLSHEMSTGMTDRGTGYNYFNGDYENFYAGGGWSDMPEARLESIRTGWPTISDYGTNGEILAWHAGGVFFMKRDVKGEGAWSEPVQVPNPDNGKQLTWPRIAASGANNDIIHVVSANQESGTNINTCYYSRSLDGGATWTTTSLPAIEEENLYSADDYSIATNGDNVAILLFGGVRTSVVLLKSTDNGETWTAKTAWENPYEGIDWADEASIYTDTMFGPANVALAVDYAGVAHVVMSTYEYIHSEVGDTYTIWSGRSVDGVAYWDDTQEGPLTCENGNPHEALRLWWPDAENPGYVTYDTPELYKFCGYLPLFEDYEFDQDKLYDGQDYFYKFYSRCSAQPCISVDPEGLIAVAYSCPDERRTDGNYYFRSIFVSYKDKNGSEWSVAEDCITEDFIHSQSDCIWLSCSPKALNPSEFFFTYMEDGLIGIYNFINNETGAPYGTNQTGFTENYVNVVRVITPITGQTELVNPLNEVTVYPNPASSDQTLNINSAMSAEAVITFHNIAGQMVKSINKTLSTGINGVSINDLTSGVYFCTINANGYNKTVKVVVK